MAFFEVFGEIISSEVDKTLNHSQASQYLAMSQAMTHVVNYMQGKSQQPGLLLLLHVDCIYIDTKIF